MSSVERCGKYVTYEVRGATAIVTLRRDPVNSLNLDVFEGLTEALNRAHADPSLRAVVFRSGLERPVFTSGNDIMELYAPATSAERYDRFWRLSNAFFMELYGSPLATVAAIRGASPAGGCMLSMACDYRVMTDKGAIGLNEVALSIPVPRYWAELMAVRIGQAQARRLTLSAIMSSPQEALKIGLIDEITTFENLDEAALRVAKRLGAFDKAARSATKAQFTAQFIDDWTEYLTSESEGGWAHLSNPKTVAGIKKYIESLRNKATKK